MRTHVKVIAVLFIVIGACILAAAFFSPIVLGVIATVVGTSHEEGAAAGAAILGLMGLALSAVLLVIGVPYVLCGWGLFKLRGWARILAIVLAALALTSFPLGTAFGVYALVILFRKDTEALFSS